MQIGAMNHPSQNPVQEIEWFGNNGFDFVDFTLEPPSADPDGIDVDAIRAALERHNLGVVAHTAYYLPLASPFSSVRQVCLEEFKRALQAAHQIGATVMNTHFDKPPKFFTEQQTVQTIRSCFQSDYRVISASTKQQALDLLSKKRFDLVFVELDIL